MLPYPTLDYLPDLQQYRMDTAGVLRFEPYAPAFPGTSWDNRANYFSSEQYALLRDTFEWQGKKGATYDFSSSSFFDPFLIQVYDHLGNVVATGGAGNDGTYGSDYLWGFEAPYSGTFYVSAGWDQGYATSHRYVSLSIYEDVDTMPDSTPIAPGPPVVSPGPSTPTKPSASDWIEDGVDVVFYLQQNPDVFGAGLDGRDHFMNHGWAEGRDPNAFFDTDWYLGSNPDVAAIGMNPLTHYMNFGWKEGRDPSANFDSSGYLEQNPDVQIAGINPLEHYLSWGFDEGRAF